MKRKINFILFMFVGLSSYCQTNTVETIEVYKSKKEFTVNPDLDKIDSLKSASEFYVGWKECPTYFFIEHNDTITLEDKINNIDEGKSNSFAYCQIESDWMANIISIKIIAYSHQPKIEDVKKFFNEIRVKPLKRFGYSVGSKCTYKVKI